MEENKANRQKALESASVVDGDDVLETLLDKLRNGDIVGRRTARRRPVGETRSSTPPTVTVDATLGHDTIDIARDMLARLQSDGFVAAPPASPTVGATQRRRRRRTERGLGSEREIPGSPLSTEIQEDSKSETQAE